MAAKKKGKPGSKKSKVSATKLSNKHHNKLAKQGKLKQEKNSRRLKLVKEKKAEEGRRGNEQQFKRVTKPLRDEDDMVIEEDIDFYRKKGKHSSFVANVKDSVLAVDPGSSGKGKKRKLEDDTNNEEQYEMVPRKIFSPDNDKKMMLPIKTKRGIVPRIFKSEDVVPAVNGDAEYEDEDEEEEAEPEPLPVLSGVELYAHRQKKLRERKQKIAILASAIVENPEESTKKLRELVSMLSEKDPDVYVTVRKLTMMSLLEVFKDIIPGYHIRMPTDKEKNQKMKRETKSILGHEIALLKSYHDYLEFLDKTAKGNKATQETKKKKKKRKQGRAEEEAIPAKSQKALRELSVRCLCELLNKHSHFNYRNNIIMVIVPYMNNNNTLISDTVCNCIRQAFREDKSGSVTLEITRCIGKMIKARDYRVQPKVLNTFLSLRIKEVSYTDPIAKAEEEKKQHNDKLSRREKKMKKKQMFLERDLQETKATEDKRRRLKLHTETIQAVFLTYFRILKKASNSVLLPSVLEGLAKFAHLINVDFFDDLFAVFNKLIAEEELSYRESLHCVQTAFTILTGQGSVLNIDPVLFYRHLYKNLFHVHAGTTSGDIKIVLDSLDIMISKRKRQVSHQRILAFLKRLTTLSLQQTSEGTLGLLAAIRSFLITYNYTDMLMDNEAQGSGVYLPELEDPEHCNAHNTMLWELTLLKHHYDPTVRKFCSHVRKGAPTSGEGQIPPDLRKDPRQLVGIYEKLDFFNQYVPEKPKTSKYKMKKLEGFLQPEFGDEVLTSLKAVNDSPNIT